MASGEVSQDEIAAALAQSMDMPVPMASGTCRFATCGLPPAGRPPAGLPPAGLPPAGLPPSPVKEVPPITSRSTIATWRSSKRMDHGAMATLR